jgi:hypothetical protein
MKKENLLIVWLWTSQLTSLSVLQFSLKADGVAEVVKHLPNNDEALSSSSSTAKKTQTTISYAYIKCFPIVVSKFQSYIRIFDPFWIFFFCTGWEKLSSFSLLHVDSQFSQHHLLKRLSFLQCMVLAPLSEIRWCSCMDLFLGWFLGLHVYFYAVPRCFVTMTL